MRFTVQHISKDQLNEKEAFKKLKENFAKNILGGVLDHAFSEMVEYEGDEFNMYSIQFREPKEIFVYEYIDDDSEDYPLIPKNGLYKAEIFNDRISYSRKLSDPERYGLKLKSCESI